MFCHLKLHWSLFHPNLASFISDGNKITVKKQPDTSKTSVGKLQENLLSFNHVSWTLRANSFTHSVLIKCCLDRVWLTVTHTLKLLRFNRRQKIKANFTFPFSFHTNINVSAQLQWNHINYVRCDGLMSLLLHQNHIRKHSYLISLHSCIYQ